MNEKKKEKQLLERMNLQSSFFATEQQSAARSQKAWRVNKLKGFLVLFIFATIASRLNLIKVIFFSNLH